MAEGVRDVVLNELPFRGISINTLAGADAHVAIAACESGTLFVNFYTTATTYTLPAVADGAGKWFWFYDAQSTAGMKITATTACLHCDDGVHTYATGGNAWGNSAIVIGDGTYYYLIECKGTWTGT